MFDYYVLEDEENKGKLVRQDPTTLEEMYYDNHVSNWETCDILLGYMNIENENFGKYHHINEKEAVVYLNRLMFLKFYEDGFANPEE